MTFTLEQPSQIAIDGTTLSIGGHGLTVSGTFISIGSSGLVIGSSTINVQAPAPTTIMTTDGQVVTLEQSGRVVAVGGITLSAGGPAATVVSGASISVGSFGDLIIGTDTIALPSGSGRLGNGSSASSSGFDPFTSIGSSIRATVWGGVLMVLAVMML